MLTEIRHKFNVSEIRKDFPILNRIVSGKPLIYLDNAATTQKPECVINVISHYYRNFNSNIHRGVYSISAKASEEFDYARKTVRNFIGAKSESEIIFTRGTTEAINLVAYSYGRTNVSEGDEILISAMEHHANIVPWQVLCEEKKARLKIIPITDKGEIILEEYEKLLNEKVKLVAVCHVSNTLGTVNPVKQMISLAHRQEIPVLVDGAQAVQHMKVDVDDLDADFYCFSSHKVYGPMGIGVLYGKSSCLEFMPPYQTGGDMISSVSFEKTTYNELPMKFEAGTPNVEGAIGLKEALDYVNRIGIENIAGYEKELLEYASYKLSAVEGIKIIGTAAEKTSVISFVVNKLNALDIGLMLDTYGVCVRTGHHCTEPLMKRFQIPGTVRVSISFYNTKEEIDYFADSLNKVIERLRK
ncbi:MAG: cysteine desulfurase [Ignavibacteria bacterium]|nr:cysteine desulfurase [Ignavibacteria bacterium]